MEKEEINKHPRGWGKPPAPQSGGYSFHKIAQQPAAPDSGRNRKRNIPVLLLSLSPGRASALKERCEMDNSHIFRVSQQHRSPLLPQPPRSLLATRRVLDTDQQGSACKQLVCVGACAHTHVLPTPLSPLPRNGKRYGKMGKESKHWRKGFSFTAGSFRRSR